MHLLNIVDVSMKVLDENVNLTRIKMYISKEAWNHLKKLAGTRPGKRLNFKPP
jgi:hypothetical protein